MDTSEIFCPWAGRGSDSGPRPCWVTVAVAGEIDLASAPEVLATLLASSRSETAGIVVEVSGVTSFGTAGVSAAFVRPRNHEREHRRDLLLRAPPPVVRGVLDICNLADLVGPAATAEPQVRPGDRFGEVAAGAASAVPVRPMNSRLG
jgi:anti-sigma B factor antagonist